jgi:hypothetical protein
MIKGFRFTMGFQVFHCNAAAEFVTVDGVLRAFCVDPYPKLKKWIAILCSPAIQTVTL